MFKPLAPRALRRLLLPAASVAVVLCTHATAHLRRQDAPPVVAANAPAETSADVRRGVELLRRGDEDAAVKHLKAVVKRAPEDADAWHFLGVAQTGAGKPKDAVKSFRRAVSLRPAFAAARAGLAYALFVTKKPDEATAEAARASNGVLDADSHFLLARVRLLFNDPPGALKHLDAAVGLAPDFAAAHLLRSQTLVRWRDPSAGPPPDPSDKEKLAALRHAGAGRMAEAAASLETYLRLRPRADDADLWRGQLASLRHYAQLLREHGERAFDSPGGVTRKAVITFKPEAVFTEEARERGVEGIVRLRLTLDADGTVKHVLVLEGLPHGLTESSVRAARNIKFKPAELNGRPVPTPVVVEYNFNIY